MTEKKNFRSSQIHRVDGKGVFVEVLNSAFRIGKVQINFVQYDTNTNKQTKKIDTFLDIDDALLLTQNILSGRINALGKQALALKEEKGYRFAKEIYLKQGGVHAATLVKRNQAREDGKALGREFKITPGDKMPWIFSAEQGPGKEMENGLIKMEKQEEIIRVPMDDEGMKKFALVLKSNIDAYYAELYSPTGDYGHIAKREHVEDLTKLIESKEVVDVLAKVFSTPQMQDVLAKAVLKGIETAKKPKA